MRRDRHSQEIYWLIKVPNININDEIKEPKESAEFMIDSFYFVKKQAIFAGILVSGTVKLDDILYLGPDSNGKFKAVVVKEIHYRRASIEEASSGQSCTFLVGPQDNKDILDKSIYEKGMVLIGNYTSQASVQEFEAYVIIFHNPTIIKPSYEAVIHSGVVSQTARIITMDKDYLQGGDKALVRFRFIHKPEFIKEGAKILIRDSRIKGFGIISSISS